MIFDRVKLREAVVRALADSREQFDRNMKSAEQDIRDMRNQWVADHGDIWRVACASIIEKLDANRPIMDSDIPGNRNGGRLVFSIPWRRDGSGGQEMIAPSGARRTYHPPQELLNFLTVLDLSSDATVSSNALKELGFGNLKKIVTYLKTDDPTA